MRCVLHKAPRAEGRQGGSQRSAGQRLPLLVAELALQHGGRLQTRARVRLEQRDATPEQCGEQEPVGGIGGQQQLDQMERVARRGLVQGLSGGAVQRLAELGGQDSAVGGRQSRQRHPQRRRDAIEGAEAAPGSAVDPGLR